MSDTLEQVVADAIDSAYNEDGYLSSELAAVRVLAAIRDHLLSDETRLRVVDGMAESSATQDEWWANVIAALFGEDR